MITKLSVTVAVDLDLTSVTIRAAGQLSADNVRGLLAVVSRAERTLPHFVVRLDLEHLRSLSPEALRLLQQSAVVLETGDTALAHGSLTNTADLRLAA